MKRSNRSVQKQKNQNEGNRHKGREVGVGVVAAVGLLAFLGLTAEYIKKVPTGAPAKHPSEQVVFEPVFTKGNRPMSDSERQTELELLRSRYQELIDKYANQARARLARAAGEQSSSFILVEGPDSEQYTEENFTIGKTEVTVDRTVGGRDLAISMTRPGGRGGARQSFSLSLLGDEPEANFTTENVSGPNTARIIEFDGLDVDFLNLGFDSPTNPAIETQSFPAAATEPNSPGALELVTAEFVNDLMSTGKSV